MIMNVILIYINLQKIKIHFDCCEREIPISQQSQTCFSSLGLIVWRRRRTNSLINGRIFCFSAYHGRSRLLDTQDCIDIHSARRISLSRISHKMANTLHSSSPHRHRESSAFYILRSIPLRFWIFPRSVIYIYASY